MKEYPISPYIETGGMMYFSRMTDKIRKMAAGTLHEDYHENMGKGFDGLCTGFLRVNYEDLKEKTLSTSSDEVILEWCFDKGRGAEKVDLLIWNTFMQKAGRNDFLSQKLEAYKEAEGMSDRTDIETLFEFFEVDEGRRE